MHKAGRFSESVQHFGMITATLNLICSFIETLSGLLPSIVHDRIG
jgi:hypothetical protein